MNLQFNFNSLESRDTSICGTFASLLFLMEMPEDTKLALLFNDWQSLADSGICMCAVALKCGEPTLERTGA